MDFLQEIDLLCVPTSYQEPKGLFVLEAVAAGVPYLQPAHGAFPEIHARLQHGQLFEPGNKDALLHQLKLAIAESKDAILSDADRVTLQQELGIERMGERVLAVLRRE